MENRQLLKNILLIALGVTSRLLPHPANFTAVMATGIFSRNLLIPLTSMVISDFIIGFDSLNMRLAVYGSIAIGVIIARLVGKKANGAKIMVVTVTSSLLFFLITNYAVWESGTMYSKNLNGLIACYTLAIPFFKNAIMGDLFYTGMLFGIQKAFSLRKNGLKLTNFQNQQ